MTQITARTCSLVLTRNLRERGILQRATSIWK